MWRSCRQNGPACKEALRAAPRIAAGPESRVHFKLFRRLQPNDVVCTTEWLADGGAIQNILRSRLCAASPLAASANVAQVDFLVPCALCLADRALARWQPHIPRRYRYTALQVQHPHPRPCAATSALRQQDGQVDPPTAIPETDVTLFLLLVGGSSAYSTMRATAAAHVGYRPTTGHHPSAHSAPPLGAAAAGPTPAAAVGRKGAL